MQGPTTLLNLRDIKPLEALMLLKENLPDDPEGKAAWRSSARVAAVLGSCPRTLKSFMSGKHVVPVFVRVHACSDPGLRHWITFIEVTHGAACADSVAFPPRMDDVLAWSNTFRSINLAPLCFFMFYTCL